MRLRDEPHNDTDVEVTAGIEPAWSGFAVRCIADLPGHQKIGEGYGQRSRNLRAGGAVLCQLSYALMEWITEQGTILQPAGSEPAALPVELPVNGTGSPAWTRTRTKPASKAGALPVRRQVNSWCPRHGLMISPGAKSRERSEPGGLGPRMGQATCDPELRRLVL